MTNVPQDTVDLIAAMDDAEAQRYLMAMFEQDPDLFYSVHDDLVQLNFLEELKDETHNGYYMYPELFL
tara:strand:- start:113 stop:316 length:204 start_codon:yes stop_codon:yes gene_type:complete